MPLSSRILACGICVLSLLLAAPLAAQEELVDSALGFTLKIPEGFKPDAEIAQENPKIAHAFLFQHPEDETQNMILIIEKMRGTIGRERLEASSLPPGINAKLFVTQWQGYEVDGVELAEETEELQLTTYNIQIPLKQFAIQIKLTSQPQNKIEQDRVLRFVLDNLQGQSNWETPAAGVPARNQDPNNNYGKALLTCGIISIIAGLLLLFWISKKTPQGTVLAISVLIWLAGSSLGNSDSREGQMTSGCLKMLGVAGIILGVVDLVRGRKPPQPPTLPMAEIVPGPPR